MLSLVHVEEGKKKFAGEQKKQNIEYQEKGTENIVRSMGIVVLHLSHVPFSPIPPNWRN